MLMVFANKQVRDGLVLLHCVGIDKHKRESSRSLE